MAMNPPASSINEPTHHSAQSNDPNRALSPIQHMSPSDYATAVARFSDLKTGIGLNHGRLAEYLRTLREQSTTQYQPAVTQDNFLTIYEFTRSSVQPVQASTMLTPPSPQATYEKWSLKLPKHFKSCEEFSKTTLSLKTKSPGLILFLRGFPAPNWVGQIGSTLRVDPELFSRWLDFRAPDDISRDFSFPSLASHGLNLLEVPILTIGILNTRRKFSCQGDLDSFRKASAESLRNYHRDISRSHPPTGESVIRDVYIFDDKHFAIEQKIMISMQPPQTNPKLQAELRRGWSLIVWTDAGDDLGERLVNGKRGPWASMPKTQFPDRCTLFQSVKYRPGMGLTADKLGLSEAERRPRTLHTRSALHLDYGRSLRHEYMVQDAFYSLAEVFEHATTSHKQFLNMLDRKLDQHTESSTINVDGLNNLKYIKRILTWQIRNIQRVCLLIHNTKLPHSKWPRSTDTGRGNQDAVLQDYKDILEQAENLKKASQEAITVFQSNIAILESQKAIVQAERVTKLTFVAFVFVPMSFTTSFFGMEFVELANLHLWIWAAMTFPIMVAVIALFFFDVSKLWENLVSWTRSKIRWPRDG